MKDSEKVDEATGSVTPKPVISAYRPAYFGRPAPDRSPFELARDAEKQAAFEIEMRRKEEEAQALRIAELLEWAKSKGLVAADATELPSAEQQLALVAQAGLSIS